MDRAIEGTAIATCANDRSLVLFCCDCNRIPRIMVLMMDRTRTRPIILLVEDYADSRQMLTLLLESMEYLVLPVASGKEAIAAAANTDIDLVITDFNLPDTTGPAVVRYVRELGNGLADVPVVMLTAIDGDEHRSLAAEAGCNAFLLKPTDFELLRVTIDRLLRVHPRQRSTELVARQ